MTWQQVVLRKNDQRKRDTEEEEDKQGGGGGGERRREGYQRRGGEGKPVTRIEATVSCIPSAPPRAPQCPEWHTVTFVIACWLRRPSLVQCGRGPGDGDYWELF